MAATGNRGGGRRSKGDRRLVSVRVPKEVHDELTRVAVAEDAHLSDLVGAYIEKCLKERTESNLQQRLPISIAS